jgi:hypothetical protein
MITDLVVGVGIIAGAVTRDQQRQWPQRQDARGAQPG